MFGKRYHDLVEANKQRAHEARMERRSSNNKKLIIGGLIVIGVVLANRRHQTETIEIHENHS